MSIGSVPPNHVAIIGTGFGGIATAVRLQKAGFDDLVLLDRAIRAPPGAAEGARFSRPHDSVGRQ